jgi:hypothetical protein
VGRFGRAALYLLAFVALSAGAQTPAQRPSIRFAEPVKLSLKNSTADFDAYGRRFSLSLVDNERVLQKLPTADRDSLQGYRLLRGSLDGVPGSWVRLTETPTGIEGAIWDGREFYAVTRYENIADFLTTPMTASPDQAVVYRLSDARDALPQDFCALAPGPTDAAQSTQSKTALDQYNTVVSELTGLYTPTVTRQVEISLIADTAFQQGEGSDPTAAMLARLNIVEGIFSEQIGLLILATDVRLMPAGSDPFTSTKPSTLLEQLSSYRSATAAVRARGLAHLMTGKDMDGTTAGIAYVKTVCDRERAVSVSQKSYGTTLSAIIMAHELGHNLGAEHDGESGTACASTSGTAFIMSPSVSGYATFSQCSMDVMAKVIAAASCVTPAQYADVTVEPGASSVAGEAGAPFTLPFTVRSIGNQAASDAAIVVTLPAISGAAFESASSSQGSCSVSGLTATCALGSMAVNSSAQVSFVGRGTSAANFVAQARVAAGNDRLTSNNNRQITVSLRSGIDARVTLAANAAEVALGSPLLIHADVYSQRAMSVRNATLSLNLNQPVTSVSLAGGTCTVNASSVSCAIPEIEPGTARRLTVAVNSQTAGALFASASVTAAGDGDLTNNNANTTAWVQAERDIQLDTPEMYAELGVNAVYEIPYTLRSRGPLPTGEVALELTLPAAVVVDSLDAGVPCSQPTATTWRCEFGALPAGAAREIRLRVHATAPVSGAVSAIALTTDDGFPGNNAADVQLRIDHLVDLGITLASGGSGIEDVYFEGQVALRSSGRQTAIGGTLDIDLHAAGVIVSASIHKGVACSLLSPTRARCALPNLVRNASLYVDYVAQFADPGDYDVRFTATAVNDSAPDNDTLWRAVLVRPYFDAAVTGSLEMGELFGGQTRVKTFTLTSDRRALATTRLLAAHTPPALSVEAISAPGGVCQIQPEQGGICDFTDLPAFASVPVTVTYRAAEGAWQVEPVVSVSTPGDVASGNNLVTAKVETFGSTDVELRVGATASGQRSVTLSFPDIELVNGAGKAIAPRVEITLPAQLTVVDVSANDAVCSGTTTLRCDFSTLDALASAHITLSVRASSEGRFLSQVRVSAANDSNAANDSREVTLEISASQAVASNATVAGGGGGGRFEWLALAILALMTIRKARARRAAVR